MVGPGRTRTCNNTVMSRGGFQPIELRSPTFGAAFANQTCKDLNALPFRYTTNRGCFNITSFHAQFAGPRRMFKLAGTLQFADPFTCDAKASDHFFKVVCIHTNTDRMRNTRSSRAVKLARTRVVVSAQISMNGCVQWLYRIFIFNKIAKMAVFFISNRSFKANRLLGYFKNLAHLIYRHRQLSASSSGVGSRPIS